MHGNSGDGQNLIDIDLNIKNGNLKQIKEILSSPAFERVDARTCWILTAWKRRDSFNNITNPEDIHEPASKLKSPSSNPYLLRYLKQKSVEKLHHQLIDSVTP